MVRAVGIPHYEIVIPQPEAFREKVVRSFHQETLLWTYFEKKSLAVTVIVLISTLIFIRPNGGEGRESS